MERIDEHPLDDTEHPGEGVGFFEGIMQIFGCAGTASALLIACLVLLGAATRRAKMPVPRVCPNCGGPCAGNDTEWWCLECGYGGSR